MKDDVEPRNFGSDEGDELRAEGLELDEEDPEAWREKAEGKVNKLRAEIETLRKEKQEYLDGWQRAKADYVNALRRFEEERAAATALGVVAAAKALLPALEALERAKEHGEVPENFSGIARHIEEGFAKLGIESVGSLGETFNPALHEALGQDATNSEENDGHITAVLERGWKMNGTVIRPAKVRVAHFQN